MTPAIRDIFDIHYAVKNRLIDIEDMVSVKHKLDILNQKIDLSNNRKTEFLSQLQTDLKPVKNRIMKQALSFIDSEAELKAFQKVLTEEEYKLIQNIR